MNPHRRVPTARTVVAALLTAGLLAGCGDETSEPTVSGSAQGSNQMSAGDRVAIVNSRFGPDPLVVPLGTVVTFENQDPFAHTVTTVDDAGIDFDSGRLDEDEAFEQTFDTAGSYPYFCEIHPTMRAEIVVRPE